MLRRVRWTAVVVGIALTLLFLFLILVLGSRFFPNPTPEGVVPQGPARYIRLAFSVLVPLFCLLTACTLGGLAAGALSTASPGLNGAVGATLALVGAFLWLTWGIVPWVFVTPSNPGEVFTKSDNIGTLIVLTLAFCAVLPLGVAAGFVGGRLGGRLRPTTRP